MRIDKESQFLAMSNSVPLPRWEHQLPPDPSLVWGPLAPIAVYFQNITVYFKSY